MLIERDLFIGFIKLHILAHAGKEDIFGLEIIQELGRHGYKMSPGTIYPLFHKLEKHGFLASRKKTTNGKVRKYYRLTPSGEKILEKGRKQALELINELEELK